MQIETIGTSSVEISEGSVQLRIRIEKDKFGKPFFTINSGMDCMKIIPEANNTITLKVGQKKMIYLVLLGLVLLCIVTGHPFLAVLLIVCYFLIRN